LNVSSKISGSGQEGGEKGRGKTKLAYQGEVLSFSKLGREMS